MKAPRALRDLRSRLSSELRPATFGPDLAAGLTLWAVLAPQAVAYSELARMPPETALAMVPLALAIYGLVGPSQRMVAGVNTAMALTSATIAGAVAGGDPGAIVALTPALAMLTGGILFLVGATRLARISDFVAKPVITGFLMGVAVLIVVGQLPKILGLPSPRGSFVDQVLGIVGGLPGVHLATLSVGAASLLLLVLLDLPKVRFPGATLLVVVLGILASLLFGLEGEGVEVVGRIPSARFAFAFPRVSWSDLRDLLSGALGLSIIAFAESLAIARRLASRRHRSVQTHRELMALGAANLGVGLLGGFAVCGSLSATQVNERAGARTALSSLFGGFFILLTGLYLTATLRPLPSAVLGVVVFQAALGSMRIHSFARLWGLRRTDFFLALVALVGVLWLGILRGLLLSVLISIGWLVARASRTPYSILGEVPGDVGFEDVDRNEEAKEVPGILIFRLDVPLFFANARRVHRILRRLLDTKRPRTLVVDMELTWELDTTGLDELASLIEGAEEEGVVVCLARVRAPIRRILRESSVLASFGDERIFLTVHAAVQHHRAPSSKALPAPAKK